MEAKIKHIGTKIMVQTSSVKMCDFFYLFSGLQTNRLCVGKSLVQASSPECQKPRSNKNCSLRILLSQTAIDVSVTSSCAQKMTQITETKETNM